MKTGEKITDLIKAIKLLEDAGHDYSASILRKLADSLIESLADSVEVSRQG